MILLRRDHGEAINRCDLQLYHIGELIVLRVEFVVVEDGLLVWDLETAYADYVLVVDCHVVGFVRLSVFLATIRLEL